MILHDLDKGLICSHREHVILLNINYLIIKSFTFTLKANQKPNRSRSFTPVNVNKKGLIDWFSILFTVHAVNAGKGFSGVISPLFNHNQKRI